VAELEDYLKKEKVVTDTTFNIANSLLSSPNFRERNNMSPPLQPPPSIKINDYKHETRKQIN